MKQKMKIFCVMVIMLVMGFTLTGCAGTPTSASRSARPASDPNYTYRVTGDFAGWTSFYEDDYMMENVAANDPRINSIGALSNALYIYLYEYTPDTANPAGWTVDYPGFSIDGNFAVKIIRLVSSDYEPEGWEFDIWIPSTEAGGVTNLTPDTLITPANRSDEARDAARDGLGSYNDNPALRSPGTYYIVFAVMNDRTRAIGAVLK